MPRTLQKKNNFNHGMVAPEMVERVDLDILNKSAELLENFTPVQYGGVRSRRGTTRLARLAFQSSALTTGTVTSSLGDASVIQTAGSNFKSNAIGTVRELFKIAYPAEMDDATFSIYDLCFDYAVPSITLYWQVSGQNAVQLSSISLNSGGVGFEGTYAVPPKGRTATAATLNLTYDDKGSITNATIANRGSYMSTNTASSSVRFQRTGSPRVYNASLMLSNDNSVWTKHSTIQITENAQDFTFNIKTPFKYLKLVLDDTEDVIKTRFLVNYVQMDSGEEEIELHKAKELGFIDSKNEKFVIIIAAKNICIYKDGVLDQLIIAPVFTEDVFDGLKWAAKDDTIIFTHKDMPPQRLLKTDTGWNFGAFPLENIPMAAFGEPTRTTKTDPITPSGTDGTVVITGTNFTSDMVGQYIDGGGAYAKIVEFISETQLRVRTIIPFYTTDKINSWTYISGYQPVWSDTHGWPRTCAFVEQRLAFGGSRDLPANIWLSRIGDYNNFENIGNYDNDAIDYPMDTSAAIVNMAVQRNLHIFTYSEEWTVPEDSFTPNKFRAARMNQNGCWADVMPIVYENSVLYVDRNGRNLYYYGYVDDAGGFVSQNLSKFYQYQGLPICMAIERNSVKDKGNFLYLVMNDGSMCIHALGMDENINAPCIFRTDGEVMAAADLDDDVFLVVQRGGNLYLEKITDSQSDFESTRQIVSGQIQGLDDYIGRRIVITQGAHHIFTTVDDNAVASATGLSDGTAVVGIPFTYKLVPNPVSIGGQTTALFKRINRAIIETLDTPQIRLNNQVARNQSTYIFYAVSGYLRDCRYEISGEYLPVRILSIQLDLSYEG